MIQRKIKFLKKNIICGIIVYRRINVKRDYNISVAMATYNGEKYIKEQIESILNNLNTNDELIISDDGSKDSTIDIIKKINDKRIKLINGPRLGVKQNFANAISNCNGKYIFLSDQDDIWYNGKVELVLEIFESQNCILVQHDCEIINSNKKIILDSFFKYRKCGKGILKNIYKNTYIGCCMAFRNDIKNKILPIPNNIEMHDQWIGILSETIGKVYFLKKVLLKYRRHENNVSDCFHHYKIKKMIINRINFIINFSRVNMNRRKK